MCVRERREEETRAGVECDNKDKREGGTREGRRRDNMGHSQFLMFEILNEIISNIRNWRKCQFLGL